MVLSSGFKRISEDKFSEEEHIPCKKGRHILLSLNYKHYFVSFQE